MSKIILFDFFGVISGSIYTNIIEKFLPEDEYAFWMEKLNDHDKGYFSEDDFVKMISKKSGLKERDIWSEVSNQLKLNEELLSFISELSYTYKIGLFTNITRSLLERVLGEKIKLFDKELQFISSDIGLTKPDPNFFKYVFLKTSKISDKVIFIDDNETNINLAEISGIKSILYKDMESLKKEISIYLN